MRVSRESIHQAVFQRLQTAQGFDNYSRRFIQWGISDTPPGKSLFMLGGNELVQDADAWPLTKYDLRLSVMIYFAVDSDLTTVPASALNNLLDAIEVSLSTPILGDYQTLGGLVLNCSISGEIVRDDTGLVNNYAIAVIPISIRVGV